MSFNNCLLDCLFVCSLCVYVYVFSAVCLQWVQEGVDN